jgi:hypothetical protein
VVVAVEGVDFLAPFKFYRDEPRTLTIEAQFTTEGDDVIADCRLIGSRLLPNQEEPQVSVHFTGRVRLAREEAKSSTIEVPADSTDGVTPADIYAIYFHGPAYQVLDGAWRRGSTAVGRMSDDLPDNHHPAHLPLRINPRLIELCFQTAGIWEMGTDGLMGLPMRVGRVATNGTGPASGRLLAVSEAKPDGSFRVRVVDEAGLVLVELDDYRTVQLPGGVAGDKLAPLQAAMENPG